jgi:alpha-mannosidase
MARFEVPAQKWVDLSEGDYGVSLLNDCKYGHDIRDNVMRISLLRSPTEPDPEADQGLQQFTYSLLPHAGRWGQATLAAAYQLNDPLLVSARPVILSEVEGRGSTPLTMTSAAEVDRQPFITANRANIVIETIKRAEDGQGVIVRFYEAQRQRGEVTLTASFPIARAEIVNLLEAKQAELTPHGQHVTLFVTPYQIVTLRLVSKTA